MVMALFITIAYPHYCMTYNTTVSTVLQHNFHKNISVMCFVVCMMKALSS